MVLVNFLLRRASSDDFEPLFDLRSRALHEDLVRCGLYAPERNRARFARGFRAEWTGVLEVERGVGVGVGAGRPPIIGCIALRPDAECVWLESFYVEPTWQGHGLGSALLRFVLLGDDPAQPITFDWRPKSMGLRPVRLNVLAGSAARALYERFGFIEYATEVPHGFDEWMELRE